jgi:nitrogen fixation protein NifZ
LRFEGRRYASHLFGAAGVRKFELGERVRAARPLRNDGTYPHRSIGEILVSEGDTGFVIEIVRVCDGTYYAVEFVDRAVVLEARSRDLVRVEDAPSAAAH